MNNLAGVKEPLATAQCTEELTTASIDVVSHADATRGEVSSCVTGRLVVGPYTFTFRRAWVYWIVAVTPTLPQHHAVAVNRRPYVADGTKYSGGVGILGDVARIDGYAGGTDPRPTGTGSWHVDTAEALRVFVGALREEVSGVSAADAMASETLRMVRCTDDLAEELAGIAPTTGTAKAIARSLLRDPADYNIEDPRIAAWLKAVSS